MDKELENIGGTIEMAKNENKLTENLLTKIDELLTSKHTVLDRMTKQELEILRSLIKAKGTPIAAENLVKTVRDGIKTKTGETATAGRAATIVSQIRKVLGNKSILTVIGVGYCIGKIDESILNEVD